MVINNDGNPIEGLPPSKGNDEIFDIDYSDLVMEKIIGRGSFGQVQKASYHGTEVAVKQLSSLVEIDPDYFKFMQREIRILMNMRHPNIVQMIGACKQDEKHMIITEYIGGGDLHTYLKQKGPAVTWSLKIKLALDIASAFSYLHSKKVIFRDLKAKNVLIEEHGASIKAKVCDFGFARMFDMAAEEKRQGYLTICGSETTMAPEVLIGSNYDETCDIYSFGILLYEMICGIRVVKNELKRLPQGAFDFECDKAYQYVPPSCPKVFCELARLCVSYEPKQRPSFKTIVMGLSDLNSKPFDQLVLKGGAPALNSSIMSPRATYDTDDNNSSGSAGTTDHESNDVNTNSVIYQGSVIYNNTINNTVNMYSTIVLEEANADNQFLENQNKELTKKNRITSSSFFKPPSSASESTVSSTTTTTETSTSNTSTEANTKLSSSPNDESDSVPSALFTSLTMDEIKYRDPSFFEDPDKIIQEKKRFMSTPSLNYLGKQSSDEAENDKPTNLAATWHPNQNPNNNNKTKKQSKTNRKKSKKTKKKR